MNPNKKIRGDHRMSNTKSGVDLNYGVHLSETIAHDVIDALKALTRATSTLRRYRDLDEAYLVPNALLATMLNQNDIDDDTVNLVLRDAADLSSLLGGLFNDAAYQRALAEREGVQLPF